MSEDSVDLNFIAALDVGTTNVRCAIINSSALIVGCAYENVKLLYPNPGWVEINPDELFKSILIVIVQAAKNANVSFDQIKSLGISTHRGTFITWKKDSEEYLHNFITWQDKRAAPLVNELNSSLPFSILKWGTNLIYFFTRIKKFGMASDLEISCSHVTGRFLWVLSHIKEVKECLKNKNLMFGTLDTWLLYKLTSGQVYVTDISNASATGLYDSFDLNWSIVAKLLKIPTEIFPEVVSNDYSFGTVSKHMFGSPLKIGCVMADQSASMFGLCCFNVNDIKLTMGTGAFLDVNTSIKIHPCLKGMYPLVGWNVKDELVYILEVQCSDSGTDIQWLEKVGLINDPYETSNIASNLENNDGVYFLPKINNLIVTNGTPEHQHPNEENIKTSRFMGITPTTTKQHKVRAVLESIVYRIVLCYKLLKRERNETYNLISVDGGVSKNNFICQMLADSLDLPVKRMASTENSILGVAYVTGLSCSMWKNKEDLSSLLKVEHVFYPNKCQIHRENLNNNLQQWMDAVKKLNP